MNKIILSISTIFIVVFGQILMPKLMAANIDEATARQYGVYYLSVMAGCSEAENSQVELAYCFMNEDLNIPAAYVFNVVKQGFVIVSGSDLWYPILGYSTEGMFDSSNMAPAFKWYMDGLCNYIIYSQNTGQPLIKNIKQEWDVLKYRKHPAMGKDPKENTWLMKSKWGQGAIDSTTYNKYCPHKTVDSVELTAYVGCVATAMSQIMYYWKYPVRPVRDTIGYECTLDGDFYDSICIDMDTVKYDFDNMPIRLSTHTPEEKINATALLCYHAGVSVEMNYGLSGSGAYSINVPNAMRDVFLYDTVIKWETRTIPNFEDYTEELVYTNDEWVAILSEEISAGRPMYYRGHSRSGSGRDAGGHAFVCDGQHATDSTLFHFNWGWDGWPNIWSDVRNNDLTVIGYNFYFNQSAVTHIQPPPRDTFIVDIPQVLVDLSPAYPNPTTTNITIPYKLNNNAIAIMQIYNMEGRLIESIPLNPCANAVKLNVSHYPKGLYLYRVGTASRKFIVE